MGKHDTGEFLVATTENLQEVVAMLRPDLCLVSKRHIDGALSLLADARQPLKVLAMPDRSGRVVPPRSPRRRRDN